MTDRTLAGHHGVALPSGDLLSTPHYVRFARSLALLGGLGAMGCPESTTPPDAAMPPSDAFGAQDAFSAEDAPVVLVDASSAEDARGSTDAAFVRPDAFSAEDAPQLSDAGNVCDRCVCSGFGPAEDAGADAGAPDCFTVPGAEICCAAIGPLMPPDLAV